MYIIYFYLLRLLKLNKIYFLYIIIFFILDLKKNIYIYVYIIILIFYRKINIENLKAFFFYKKNTTNKN